jgi:hypothetical protein
MRRALTAALALDYRSGTHMHTLFFTYQRPA